MMKSKTTIPVENLDEIKPVKCEPKPYDCGSTGRTT